MKSVETVLGIFKAMNNEEKTETILRIGEHAIADGLIKAPIGADDTGATHKPRRKGKSFMGYWAKTVESFDPTKRGAFRLVGHWVNNPSAQVAEGNLFVVGVKASGLYMLARREAGKKMYVSTDRAPTPSHVKEFEDAYQLFESRSWSDIEEKAKAMLSTLKVSALMV
jgi:hypothetical protein